MEFHPASNIFPLLEGDEFEVFKADLKRHGQRETIWTFEGKILTAVIATAHAVSSASSRGCARGEMTATGRSHS